MASLVWETRDAKTAIAELKLNCPYFTRPQETLEVICQGDWTLWLFAVDDKFTGAVRRQVAGGEQTWSHSNLTQDQARNWAEEEFSKLVSHSEEWWLMYDLLSKLPSR